MTAKVINWVYLLTFLLIISSVFMLSVKPLMAEVGTMQLKIAPNTDIHSEQFKHSVIDAFAQEQAKQNAYFKAQVKKANRDLLANVTPSHFKAKYQNMKAKAFDFVSNQSDLTVGNQPSINQAQKITTPLYFMGADKVSLRWYQANAEVLKKLHATGFALNVSQQQLTQLNRRLGIHLVSANTQGIKERFKVSHYPFLVTAKGIFQ